LNPPGVVKESLKVGFDRGEVRQLSLEVPERHLDQAMTDAAVRDVVRGKQATERENLRDHQDSHLFANVACCGRDLFVHVLQDCVSR